MDRLSNVQAGSTARCWRRTALAAALAFAFTGCGTEKAPEEPKSAAPKHTAAEADRLVADYNQYSKDNAARMSAAYWIAATYINDDAQLLASRATDETLEYVTRKIDEAKAFNGVSGISPATERALTLIKLGSTMPAPKDPAERTELSKLAAKLEANYGAGKWCRAGANGQQDCLALGQIEAIVNNTDFSHSPQELADAWAGWHATARPIRKDYQRFVEIMNHGAREVGFADTGELWRGGYDMSPADFDQEVERLWTQVEPLYKALHCDVRAKLNEKYGDAVVPKGGLIPAQLLGNMWAQQWGNLYPLMEPYPGVASLDVSGVLEKQRSDLYQQLVKERGSPKSPPEQLAELSHEADAQMAKQMTEIAEDFYTSLGMRKLPDSFWEKSMLLKPRDRDVVCHASAWPMNYGDDVRIKMCIRPDEESLLTIHHELGHIYYYLAYSGLPPIFQAGAHDGFHEAIGDTVTLSLTPEHLKKIGLVQETAQSDQAIINNQMKIALDKIVFLPWGKLVDQWRWKVFSGAIAPDRYNEGWWTLRAQYQGVSPPLARSEEDFDPGAKYHIPGNTPYTRYFLAFVLQFQFQKALCDAAGFTGPLYECDIYGNAEAGKKFMAMLSAGASQPWQDTLEKITGKRQMDAAPIIEYFQPLMQYLETQNEGRTCGWQPPAAVTPG